MYLAAVTLPSAATQSWLRWQGLGSERRPMRPVKSSISKALVSCGSAVACDWILVRDETGEWVTEIEVAATIAGRVAGAKMFPAW